MRIGAEASAIVGNTPMVLLDRLSEGLPGDVCAPSSTSSRPSTASRRRGLRKVFGQTTIAEVARREAEEAGSGMYFI